jgi:1,4-alpha-glucan branching enzyme
LTRALSIVLHTHMPYVEGFGTWPFGEEWLWEAVATSYLPLLDALDDAPGRVTVSVTPVLADQFAAPGAMERCLAFLREVRPASHRLDAEAATDPGVVAALEASAAAYAAAADALEARGGDLVAAFAPHVTWTSAATHAVLPLLATDAGVRLQLETGVAAHRARFGAWGGGLWLPECAHEPWLDAHLEEAGVHATCVDWTGRASPRQPFRSPAGPLLVPIDREAMELVWSPAGYPAHGAYRDTHNLTEHRHQAWAVDGAPYDPARGAARARADARDFVARVDERLRGGGLCVCPLDTELLGHFWHEGVAWLEAVIAGCEERGLPLLPLDAALAQAEPAPAPAGMPATSWGEGLDLRTWSSPPGGELAWAQRAAELAVLGGGAGHSHPPERALRELLALQASDWAFLVARGTAGDYPRERAAGHRRALESALAGEAGGAALRCLAPWLSRPAI